MPVPRVSEEDSVKSEVIGKRYDRFIAWLYCGIMRYRGKYLLSSSSIVDGRVWRHS